MAHRTTGVSEQCPSSASPRTGRGRTGPASATFQSAARGPGRDGAAGPWDRGQTPGRWASLTLPAMTTVESWTEELLRLAREVSTTTASFLVRADGAVTVDLLPEETLPGLDARVERLARATLDAAADRRANEIIWFAEQAPEGETEDANSLTCAAVRLGNDLSPLGLMGVADTWMPDIDSELWADLQRLAGELSTVLQRTTSAPAPGAVLGNQSGEPFGDGAQELLLEVVDTLPEPLIVVRSEGTIVYANATFGALAHRTTEELVGRPLGEFIADAADRTADAADQIAFLLGSPDRGRPARLVLPAGRELSVDIRGQRLTSEAVGDCYFGLVRDARRPSLAASEVQRLSVLEEIVESLEDGVMFCDSAGTVVLANRASRVLQGIPAAEPIVGRQFPVTSGLRSSDGTALEYEDHPLLRALHGTTVRSEHLVTDSGENRRHLLVSARPFALSKSKGALLIIRDITAQLNEESRLMELALHDPLTGLANRYLLLDYLKRSLNQAQSRGGTMTLFYLDLDDFKSVNAEYGQDVGDEVLIAVARRLLGAARSSDIVARLSGDEFVIVTMSNVPDPGGVDVVLSRIRAIFSAPYYVRGHSLFVGASVGWVVGDPREDPTSLLVRADREMYRRKQARRSGDGGENPS